MPSSNDLLYVRICTHILNPKTGTENRDLVICNNCLWAVSLLKGSRVFDSCPMCMTKSLEIMPVEDYENYKLEITTKRGLDVKFT
jgi:hypothetical protein